MVLKATGFEIIELDSTTPKKFSRHLIYRHPCKCFKSNIGAGHLVRTMLANMDDDTKQKLNLNPVGEFKCFVDEAVYTKNRNLRIWKSSKIEKGVKLEFVDKRALNFKDFEASLVTCTSGLGYFDFCTDNESISKNTNPGISKNVPIASIPLDNFYSLKCTILEISNAPSLILKAIPETNVLIATLVGNRFCLNIGREHKSNNVYYYIDLSSGRCHQRCFDVDCKGFRGPEFSILTGERIDGLFEGISDLELGELDLDQLDSIGEFFEGISDQDIISTSIYGDITDQELLRLPL